LMDYWVHPMYKKDPPQAGWECDPVLQALGCLECPSLHYWQYQLMATPSGAHRLSRRKPRQTLHGGAHCSCARDRQGSQRYLLSMARSPHIMEPWN
jgi:hypothetical protein